MAGAESNKATDESRYDVVDLRRQGLCSEVRYSYSCRFSIKSSPFQANRVHHPHRLTLALVILPISRISLVGSEGMP